MGRAADEEVVGRVGDWRVSLWWAVMMVRNIDFGQREGGRTFSRTVLLLDSLCLRTHRFNITG